MFEKYESEFVNYYKRLDEKVKNMPTQSKDLQEAAINEGETDLREAELNVYTLISLGKWN